MVIIDDLRALSGPQRAAFLASWLGWALDAFDFFLLTLVLSEIARTFNPDISVFGLRFNGVAAVSLAVFATLAARPIGALLFGRLADHYGRRPIMMINVGLYSALALASAFSPNIWTLIALRALFGVAMGGMWGIGASLALESIPPKSRGVVSGILQEGYPVGNLLAALAFLLSPWIGWRGMLALGALPALLILYVRMRVAESPAWEARRAAEPDAHRQSFISAMRGRWWLLVYVVVLMTCFNFFAHGTQDGYATFLKVQHKFGPPLVSALNVCLNLGAITGGLIFGSLSERLGRRRAIVLAALLALPIIPLWAFSATPLLLAAGAFLVQVAVQGAWGVVPAHLNELSPPEARGAFPGFAYQLGNFFAAGTLTLETTLAVHWDNNYGLALAAVTGATAVVLALVAWFGPEAKGVAFGAAH
jgi:MFS transporter, SHS family, lactate transporter